MLVCPCFLAETFKVISVQHVQNGVWNGVGIGERGGE